MSREKQHTLVPELRFPEFERGTVSSIYKKYSFTDVFTFSTGKNIKQREAHPNFKIPCVRYGELYHMYNEVIYNVINKTNLDKSELRFSKGNEILLPSAGEDPLDIGSASALTIENVAIGRTINVLSPLIIGLYSHIYVSYYINQKFRRKISTLAKGSSISNVYNSDLKKLEISLPSLSEQQKIANCLSSLDNLITAATEKLNHLKNHKKGLLQQLFPAKGETKPQYRFPEFKNNGDWEIKEVGEMFEVTRGYVLSMSLVKETQTEVNNYPVYSSQTKDNGLAGYYKEYLYENAITWTTDGANAGDVNYREGKFYCTNVCGVLINKNGMANKCIATLINSVSKSHVSYIGNPKLMNGVMSKIKIPIPSVSEQNKITEIISSADVLIETQTKKIETLKDHKKGLMQQLFPNNI